MIEVRHSNSLLNKRKSHNPNYRYYMSVLYATFQITLMAQRIRISAFKRNVNVDFIRLYPKVRIHCTIFTLGFAYISQQLFDTIVGLLLIAMAIFLILHPKSEKVIRVIKTNHFIRKLVEANGTNHIFSYNPIIGIGLSPFVGYISSLLGIGGGIIHVPIMVYLLNFPAHIATATSHFTLAIMALTGTIVHISMGVFSRGLRRTIFLAIGVLLGAQLGAKLSKHIHGGWIIRGLAIALGFVGIRILMMAL